MAPSYEPPHIDSLNLTLSPSALAKVGVYTTPPW